jgi:hypothetical protein
MRKWSNPVWFWEGNSAQVDRLSAQEYASIDYFTNKKFHHITGFRPSSIEYQSTND